MKLITRTIKMYTYTTGKVNIASGSITDVKNHCYPYKLGKRAKDALVESVGAPIIQETTGEALYGMSLDDFIRYAHPVTKDEEQGLEPSAVQ